ncbi:hypothetical protein [Streptomyces bungoensis]|uniref:hypothetical protein n=1 Tax=Streptomyces bungoensis TaxID=285568 RepID=UPI00343D5A81
MWDDLYVLAAFGIDPARLDPAPDGPLRYSGAGDRIHPPGRHSCSACGTLAVATRRVHVPGLGLRWQDSCRDCMVAAWKL